MSAHTADLFEDITEASPAFLKAVQEDDIEAIASVLISLASRKSEPPLIPSEEMDELYRIWRNTDEQVCVALLCSLFSEYLDKMSADDRSKVPVCYQAYVKYDTGSKILDISKIDGKHEEQEWFPQMHFDSLIGLDEDTYNLTWDLPNTTVDEALFDDASCDSIPAIAAKTLTIRISDPTDEMIVKQIEGPVADLIVFEADNLPYIDTKGVSNAQRVPIKAIKFVPNTDFNGTIHIPGWRIEDFAPDFKIYLPKGSHASAQKRLIGKNIKGHIVAY